MSLRVAAALESRGFDVDLTVAAGETVAVMGPNGAGKSTLLDVVAGVLRADEGTVTLAGQELAGPHTWVPAHRRRVALLSQDPLLFPHLSVRDNVAFAPRAAGSGRRSAREAAYSWLERLGVRELAGRRPHQISGGQAQRVALARALAAEPTLLLLDEPMAALDVDVVRELRPLLREVTAARSTVLVTHDPLDALLMADQVVILEGGRVVEQGQVHDVLTRPRSTFAARVAGLNLLRGTWRGDRLVLADGAEVFGGSQGCVEGAAAVAVFAPRAVSVFASAPGGSPRNEFAVVLSEVESRGDVVRLHAGDLAADVTPRAVTQLGLEPGAAVVFSVKAAEIAIHPA
ncbi:sulfate/molybdate ABC transporter ATP-binding protein [Nocardioides gilvus]|uniref:sulfate/molybdate ABC transporter ATP-binding protein n=1 Tax=Nocardioides gilvus TaxID=1735589 RepID=UPI000D74DB12|nr:ATP-binding cassette domain-containing protein [Nocardioides gilvus]